MYTSLFYSLPETPEDLEKNDSSGVSLIGPTYLSRPGYYFFISLTKAG